MFFQKGSLSQPLYASLFTDEMLLVSAGNAGTSLACLYRLALGIFVHKFGPVDKFAKRSSHPTVRAGREQRGTPRPQSARASAGGPVSQGHVSAKPDRAQRLVPGRAVPVPAPDAELQWEEDVLVIVDEDESGLLENALRRQVSYPQASLDIGSSVIHPRFSARVCGSAAVLTLVLALFAAYGFSRNSVEPGEAESPRPIVEVRKRDAKPLGSQARLVLPSSKEDSMSAASREQPRDSKSPSRQEPSRPEPRPESSRPSRAEAEAAVAVHGAGILVSLFGRLAPQGQQTEILGGLDQLGRAKRATERGALELAAALVGQVSSRIPALHRTCAREYVRLGNGYVRKGLQAEAIPWYGRALQLRGDYPEALYNRATAHLELGRFLEAIRDFDQAAKLRPDWVSVYNNRGVAQLERGDLLAALSDFRAAITRDSSLAASYNNRGVAHLKQRDPASALDDFRAALKLDPALAGALYNRAQAYRELGQKARARRDRKRFQAMLQNEPRLGDLIDPATGRAARKIVVCPAVENL